MKNSFYKIREVGSYMYDIEVSCYPKSREWDIKVFSIPKIPRSSKGYPESLKTILNALKENKPYNKPINIEGSSRKDTLERLFTFLRPIGIVKKVYLDGKCPMKLLNG